MHLTTAQSHALGEAMRLFAQADDGDLLREQLAKPLLELLRADQYASYAWDADAQGFGRCRSMNMTLDNLALWDKHYRFVDPITIPLMQQRHPTLATQVLSQHELMRTEFFADFLGVDRMHWGINMYAHTGERYLGDLRIWRTRRRGNFDENDLELLRLIEPAMVAALDRLHWGEQARRLQLDDDAIRELLQRRCGLSAREAEVAWLICSGCPDKAIAKRLVLEFSTVRYHVANAFRKLGVGNRAALASKVHALAAVSSSH